MLVWVLEFEYKVICDKLCVLLGVMCFDGGNGLLGDE